MHAMAGLILINISILNHNFCEQESRARDSTCMGVGDNNEQNTFRFTILTITAMLKFLRSSSTYQHCPEVGHDMNS